MKKHIIIISTILLSGVILFYSSTKNIQPERKNNAQANQYSETELNYILKDYNGRVALFYEDKEKPIEIYDVFTESLPEKDIQMMKKGIYVSGSELNNILSDYLS